ncbi:MAG: stage II sporulation protein M [archaeon]
MVLEKLFAVKWVERRPIYALLMGVLFSLFAFFTASALFWNKSHLIGITSIIFIVVLCIRGVNDLFDIEENEEAEEYAGFFKEHEALFDFFLYFFIGVFITFFVIAIINPTLVFSRADFLNIQDETPSTLLRMVTKDSDGSGLPPPPPPDFAFQGGRPTILREISAIFVNNIYVMIICFLLSLFYSSGALFLITFNASIFASALAHAVQAKLASAGLISQVSFLACNLGVMFVHTLPELAGYFLGAIAGGVLSKAFFKEKFRSKRFLRVIKDAGLLLGLSLAVLLFAAVIEVTVSGKLLVGDACLSSRTMLIVLAGLFLVILVALEYHRKHDWLHRMWHALMERKKKKSIPHSREK